MQRRRFRPSFEIALGALLFLAFLLRVAYVLGQAATDPTFARPVLDGAYYMEWARALAEGRGGPGGAFYLAPLYPYLLWPFVALFGEDFALLYYVQQIGSVAAAGLLALSVRRLLGAAEGLAAAALFLLYHPVLFYAARPVGESLALLLLVLALYLQVRGDRRGAAAAGWVGGLAAIARPNLLLVPPLWAAGEAVRKRFVLAALLLVGLAVAILPVALRNQAVSGHPVLVSANGGLTLYHGNAPGASGIGVLPNGFSGEVSTQRAEATRLAMLASGEQLDPVQADAWWGREAVRARGDDPVGTLRLLLRRCGLLLSNAELSLAFAPSLDRSALRWVAPMPFCVLLALAVSGAWLAGFRGIGGWPVGSMLLAGAVVPVLFYASSRYRLPFAALLCIPAGVGLIRLARSRGAQRLTAAAAGTLALVASLLVPVDDLRNTSEAGALVHRAWAWSQGGNLQAAEDDLRRALERDRRSAAAAFNLGVVLEKQGRLDEAQASYREALAANPAYGDAAGNLGRLLHRQGRPEEALPILRRALRDDPHHAVCWTNLVVALTLTGDVDEAWAAAEQAADRGVHLEPGLLQLVRGLREARENDEGS